MVELYWCKPLERFVIRSEDSRSGKVSWFYQEHKQYELRETSDYKGVPHVNIFEGLKPKDFERLTGDLQQFILNVKRGRIK